MGPFTIQILQQLAVISKCNRTIEEAGNTANINGWAGFVLDEKLRRVKTTLKAWNVNLQETLKRKEEDLRKEIEKCDLIAEISRLNSTELAIRSSLKAELMSLYRMG